MTTTKQFRAECFVATATRPGYARIEIEHAPSGECLTLEDYMGSDLLALERVTLDALALRVSERKAS